MQNIFDKYSKIFILIVLVVITLAVFHPVLSNDFINWDNYTNILENPRVRDFRLSAIGDIFSNMPMKSYVPLTIFSFALEYKIVGGDPFLYHLDNLLLHCAITLMIYFFGLKLKLSHFAATITALIFAIHPLHVEPVAWVSGRKDLLYAFFYMGSLLTYMRYLESKRLGAYMFCLILGALSMLAKPMAFSLPLVLLLLDWYQRRKFSKIQLLEKLPFFLYVLWLGRVSYVSHVSGTPVWGENSLLVLLWSSTFYIKQFLFPFSLNPIYQLPKPIEIVYLPYVLALVILIASICLIVKFRRNRMVLFSFLFYLISILLLLRYTERVTFSTSFVADRYMYLPSLGFCLLSGAGIEQLRSRFKKQALINIGIVLILGIMGCQSIQRCLIYKDSITFWNVVIEKNSDIANPYINRGEAYFRAKKFDLALNDFNKALTFYPKRATGYINRGAVYAIQKKYKQAIVDFSQAIILEFDNALAYHNRSLAYKDMARYREALRDALKAKELGAPIDPAYVRSLK